MQGLSVLCLKKLTFTMRNRKTGGSRLEKDIPWKLHLKVQWLAPPVADQADTKTRTSLGEKKHIS